MLNPRSHPEVNSGFWNKWAALSFDATDVRLVNQCLSLRLFLCVVSLDDEVLLPAALGF